MTPENPHSLPPLPFLTRAFKPFDNEIGRSGIAYGMRQLLDKTAGIKNLEVVGLKGETERILREEPVLLVCNHPHDAESIILLGTIPARPDTWVIAAHNQKRLGPNIAKHILPVYPHRQEQNTRNLKLSVRLAKKFAKHPYSPEEMDKRNHDTITLAAKKVSRGNLVALFPEGVSGRSGKWRNGIGFLVEQLDLGKSPFFAMAHVEGTSDWDPLRVIPEIRSLMRRGRITFANPVAISSLPLPSDPKEITQLLQQKYAAWREQISK